MEQTTINRNWLLKMMIFIIALGGLGVWGLIDAFRILPARGREHADWTEARYLEAAEKSGQLLQASVTDPRAEFVRLEREKGDIEKNTSLSPDQRDLLLARLEWLTSLSRVGLLTPERTVMPDARRRMTDLQQTIRTSNAPKPLAAYDIPMQWIFIIGGFGLAIYLTALLLSVMRKTFRWDPASKALTLPDGRRLTPADISEVDKRKWDKFFVFLKPKGGGQEIKLDLLRYKRLEEWVLEFEKDTEAYEPPREEPQPAQPSPVA